MRHPLVSIGLLGALAGLAGTASSDPPTRPINTWVTGKAVRAVARAGDRLFVGGDFTSVYPASRFTGTVATFTHGDENAAPLPALSGESAGAMALTDDGAGGWLPAGVSRARAARRSTRPVPGSCTSVRTAPLCRLRSSRRRVPTRT